MALTNNEKVGRGFQVLLEGLRPFVDARMSAAAPAGKDWVELFEAAENSKDGTNKTYSKDDVRFLLRLVTERWQVFRDVLDRPQQALATLLRQTGNDMAHGAVFSSDDTYRALDTIERLLTVIGAAEQAAKAEAMREEHQAEVYAKKAANKVQRAQAAQVSGAVAGTTIKPWRTVVTPHPDVMKGQFSASEFAADLHAVSHHLSAAPEYTDPREFFGRTFLTSGLRDLLDRATRRLSGDSGASPVVNLQTQFGGGKTHSMLALWHLFSGVAARDLPQAVQDVVGKVLPPMGEVDPLRELRVRRVALVGTRLSPGQPAQKPDGTVVRTFWGELAWQLGEAGVPEGASPAERTAAGRAAFGRIAQADASSQPPAQNLDELIGDVVAGGEKVLILIDEWVAYARLLVDTAGLPGGTFEAQFTFAQHLTELAKTTPGVMLVVSIPDAETIDAGGGGSALEVGGPNGRAALEQLQQVVGRTADDWRPATGVESFEIVRRRLFEEPTAAALADIAAVAKQYVRYYQDNTGFFPKEVTSGEYEARLRGAYPIHPELFDRLYNDWSALPKFQRTRGVLRLMSQVISSLWQAGDSAPLITPGTVPLQDEAVFGEVTKYLDDNWKSVVEADVDGASSVPVAIDVERPSFGSRSLTRRVARAVFMATVPTLRTPHKGVDMQHLRLGVAVPGDVMSHIGDARELLSQRATYFYEDGDRSWYDTARSVTRLAVEKAAGYSEHDAHAEIVRRLAAESKKGRGIFAGVHVAPFDSGDVPDGDSLRLVVLHPKHTWGKDASLATELTEHLVTTVGSGQRRCRNMLVTVAADRNRYADLDGATREYLAWRSIVDEAEANGLSIQQTSQAKTRAGQLDDAVDVRLRGTYTVCLVPTALPGEATTIAFERIGETGGSLAERVTARLKTVSKVSDVLGASLVRIALDGPLQSAWANGHVRLGDLWSWYTQYPYLKRLKDRHVLDEAALSVGTIFDWNREGFALADGIADDRYLGLWIQGDKPEPMRVTDDTLLVNPNVANAQRVKEMRERAEVTPEPGEATATLATEPGGAPTTTATLPGPAQPSTPVKAVKRRFFGVKTLNPDRYAQDFATIQHEVLAHLDAADDVQLEVRLEITAVSPKGFTEQQVRTVDENSKQLKFDQQGFEES